jgi:hypothetical protein
MWHHKWMYTSEGGSVESNMVTVVTDLHQTPAAPFLRYYSNQQLSQIVIDIVLHLLSKLN